MASKIRRIPNIIECMEDEALFGHFFNNQQSWAVWKAYLSGLFGLEMDPERLALFKQFTGRTTAPVHEFDKSFLIAGRRSGKSAIMGLIAAYLAALRDFRQFLAKGETGRIRIMSADLAQSRTIFGFVRALLMESPLLKDRVIKETADSIVLRNSIAIETGVASYKSVRGYTLICSILDEASFFRTAEDSANVDTEIVRALEPAMATVPHGKLLVASSPYRKTGILYEGWERNFGRDDAEALCWVGDTLSMNPTVDRAFVDKKLEEDYEFGDGRIFCAMAHGYFRVH